MISFLSKNKALTTQYNYLTNLNSLCITVELCLDKNDQKCQEILKKNNNGPIVTESKETKSSKNELQHLAISVLQN